MAMTKCETCGGEYNEFRIDEHCCGCTQLRAENANLKAYNATRTDELLGASHRIADLESEVAELRKDAERYRWLRGQGFGGWAICQWDGGAGDYFRCILPQEQFDAAIDTAMKEQS